jgi:hypothetical protein
MRAYRKFKALFAPAALLASRQPSPGRGTRALARCAPAHGLGRRGWGAGWTCAAGSGRGGPARRDAGGTAGKRQLGRMSEARRRDRVSPWPSPRGARCGAAAKRKTRSGCSGESARTAFSSVPCWGSPGRGAPGMRPPTPTQARAGGAPTLLSLSSPLFLNSAAEGCLLCA